MKWIVAVARDGYTTYYGPMDEVDAKKAASDYGTFYVGTAHAWPLYSKLPGE